MIETGNKIDMSWGTPGLRTHILAAQRMANEAESALIYKKLFVPDHKPKKLNPWQRLKISEPIFRIRGAWAILRHGWFDECS